VFDVNKARHVNEIPVFFFTNILGIWTDMGNRQMNVFLNIRTPFTENYSNYKGLQGGTTDHAFNETRKELIKDGFDSVITEDNVMCDGYIEYVVFHPNQISNKQ
jgi:hypothetical protein